MSCGCCSPLRPRYKRLVDNIYPAYLEDGLDTANMQKLIYYAATSPEKWDRIGEYLSSRINRDLNRNYPRHSAVTIGMEAMDELLKTCPSHYLNLYVESYLKTVQKLLECTDPDMQVRGSQSFIKFAQKEQDLPAYHIRYDFFISKFCQMCHFETNLITTTTSIRVSGLQGIGGVVRKIENENLAGNIWDPTHMDKIIPSLLYNIQIGDYKAGHSRSQTPDLDDGKSKSPLQIAEDTFRKLMGRAGFQSMKPVMKPILNHLDIHQMWTPPDFAEHVFQMVMFSIQQQVNYIIIEELMKHLDKKQDNVMVKVGIATVLSRIFSSRAVDASVGPSVLETINALLIHLKTSVEKAQASRDPDPDHQRYHEALLTALGEYSSSLPNFQMIEIMMFILSKTPDNVNESDVSSELQHVLLKALLTVAEKFVPVQFSNTFPLQFLSPLLDKLQSPDPDARLLVLRIFQTLIDRKNNLEKLELPTVEPRSDLLAQKPNSNKQDNNFFEKYGDRIYRELLSVIRVEAVGIEFLEQFYMTVSLLVLEVNSDDNIRLQLELIGELQELAVSNNNNKLRLSDANKFALHATCISLLSILSFVVRIPDIFEYKDKLVSLRKSLVPHLLPPLEEDYSPDLDPTAHIEAALIDLEPVRAGLREAGRYTDRGGRGGSVVTANSPGTRRPPSWLETAHIRRPSGVSISSVEVDVDSRASSPGIMKKPVQVELGFAEMKRALAPPTSREKENAEMARKELLEKYQTASFGELCQMTLDSRPKETLYQCLSDIYSKDNWSTSVGSASRRSSLSVNSYDTTDVLSPGLSKNKKIYEEYFPELFTNNTIDLTMDFASLLGQAQLNQIDKTTNDRSKLLKTKMSGPKKEKRDKGKIPPNVQKFLQKQAEDEKRKKVEAMQKLEKLNELRTDRAKNKIMKHLKVTKSANKAVIEDAVDKKNTSVTLNGRQQCDEDDYGYESKSSAGLYERLMSKYEADPDDPMAKFSKSRKARELKDMQGVKDRVKSSLRREEEEAQHPSRKRVKSARESSPGGVTGKSYEAPKRKKKDEFEDDGFIDDSFSARNRSRKGEDRKLSDKERKEEEARKKRIENSRKAPPPVDFNSLIKLAEVKKDIPVKIEKKVVTKEQEFGDRPMTKREKEEFMRDNQARLRREGKLPAKEKSPPIPKKSEKKTGGLLAEEKDKIPEKPKIRAEPGPSFHSAVLKSMPPPERRREDADKSVRDREMKDLREKMKNLERQKEELEKRQKVADYNERKRVEHQRKMEEFKRKEFERKQERKRIDQEKRALEDMQSQYKEMQRKMKEMEARMSGGSRDVHSVPSRHFPGEKRKHAGDFRRRLDSDSEESEDSEMDDFIDDSDAKCDYSAEIRKIFNYDKRKYRDEDEFDDRAMENNKFASIMMEEARSAKIGRREDLEDMRREEDEKKRKRRR